MMSQFSSLIHAFWKETNDQMKDKFLSKLDSIVSHSLLSLQYIVIITIVKVDFENLGNASFFWQCVVILRGGGTQHVYTWSQGEAAWGVGGSITHNIKRLHPEPMETDFWEILPIFHFALISPRWTSELQSFKIILKWPYINYNSCSNLHSVMFSK